MMLPFERKERYYNGNDTYKYIEKLLRRGKDIYIISPYIDKYYAGRIRAYSSRKKFHIISSSIEKEALDILGKQRSPMDLVISLTLLFGMDSILYYIGFFSTYAAAISAILMAILFVGFYGSEKRLQRFSVWKRSSSRKKSQIGMFTYYYLSLRKKRSLGAC